jgi:uncharacterized protein YoxC
MIIEVSVAVIAIVFTILVIYLIVLINTLRHTFTQVDRTLGSVHQQLDGIGTEAKKVIEQANHLSVDVKSKFDSLTSLFNTVSNVGAVLEDHSVAFREQMIATAKDEKQPFHLRFKSGEHATSPELEKIASILELAGLGVRLWQKLKKRK